MTVIKSNAENSNSAPDGLNGISPDEPLMLLRFLGTPNQKEGLSWEYAKAKWVPPGSDDDCKQSGLMSVMPKRPNDIMADATMEGYMHRIEGHERLLVTRGGFPENEAFAVLMNGDSESKEPIARWLRSELSRLRDGERIIGTAPSWRERAHRKQDALTRSVITDLAFTLLENIDGAPGRELLSLLQETLNVDRHRRDLSTKKEKFDRAADMEAQASFRGQLLGARELSRAMSISPSTASSWKKSVEYQNTIESHKQNWVHFLGVLAEQIPGMLRGIEARDDFRVKWDGVIKKMQFVWRMDKILGFLEKLAKVNAFVQPDAMREWTIRTSSECSFYLRRVFEDVSELMRELKIAKK